MCLKKIKNLILIFVVFCLCGCGPKTVNVTFTDYDGTQLDYIEINRGDTALYNGELPKREAIIDGDYQYSYVFSGWDKSLENIKEDTTFIAQYKETKENLTEIKKNNYTNLFEKMVNDLQWSGRYDSEYDTFYIDIADYMTDDLTANIEVTINYNRSDDTIELETMYISPDDYTGFLVRIIIPREYTTSYTITVASLTSLIASFGKCNINANEIRNIEWLNFDYFNGYHPESTVIEIAVLALSSIILYVEKETDYDLADFGI